MRKQEAGSRKQDVTAPKGFRALVAWQKADTLASSVYRAVRRADIRDRWLVSQATRSAISVPANIAEGYGRGSLGDYLRFLDIARGSLNELDYYLHFLEREGILSGADVRSLRPALSETARVLNGLWRPLKQKSRNGDWDRSGATIREDIADYQIELDEDDVLLPDS